MAIPKDKLLKELLDLKDEDRAEFAGLLIESLDKDIESGVEPAWRQEVERRIESLERGESDTVSWEDVKEKLYK
jgi:putative addiction module component (TIGR02574 family)